MNSCGAQRKDKSLALTKKGSSSIQPGSSSSPLNPNPLAYALLYNKGREKAVVDNPFHWTMAIPLMHIEDSKSLFSPRQVSEKYPRDHVRSYLKQRYWYERLLIESESVDIVHRYRSATNNMIAFSKLTILKVISFEEWGNHPYQLRYFASSEMSPNGYNFWDYQKAWDVVLCFQNVRYSHTWFVQFRLTSLKEIPNWFRTWFLVWGPNLEYLPRDIVNSFLDNFRKENPDYSEERKLFLWFMILYELPWILKWDYGFVCDGDEAWDFLPQLERKIFIRWWDKFQIDHPKPSVFKAKKPSA